MLPTMRLPPWMWRIIRSRRTKVALACAPFALCAAIAAFYPIAGWWGRQQVKRYIQDLEAAGYAVDPEKYWTPAADLDDDVFQHPTMRQEMEKPLVSLVLERKPPIPGLAKRIPRMEPRLARTADLTLWFDPPEADEKAAAERLLEGQREVVERLEALRPALARREAVWPVRRMRNEFTSGVEVATIAGEVIRLQGMAGVLGEISMFHLAAGDAGAAAADVDAMLEIARLELEPKPAIIAMIVTYAVLRNAQTTIWEGVVRERWDEAQLKAFDARLAALNPQQAAIRCHLGEIALQRDGMKLLLERYSNDLPRIDEDWKEGWDWDPKTILERSKELGGELRPPGFALADVVRSQRNFLEHATLSGGSPRSQFTGEDLATFREKEEASQAPGLDGWGMLNILISNTLNIETTIVLTRTGMALERHRMVRGAYPAALEELVPDFLPEIPADPFDGKPLRYRLQADGSPHLWSVGSDLVDDGGAPHRHSDKGDRIWITKPIPGFTERDLIRR